MSQGRRSVIDQVGFLLPVRLHQDAVDVVDVNGFVGRANGLDQAADAEIAGLAQDAVGGADDQVDGGLREGVVSQADAVQFTQEEVTHAVGTQAFGDHRVGHATFDILIDAEVESRQQVRSAHEDQVVVLGKILEQQAQLTQVGQVHEVGVVEDGGQALARVIEAEGLLDQSAFALESGMVERRCERRRTGF